MSLAQVVKGVKMKFHILQDLLGFIPKEVALTKCHPQTAHFLRRDQLGPAVNRYRYVALMDDTRVEDPDPPTRIKMLKTMQKIVFFFC
jgi:hypothetical protein